MALTAEQKEKILYNREIIEWTDPEHKFSPRRHVDAWGIGLSDYAKRVLERVVRRDRTTRYQYSKYK